MTRTFLLAGIAGLALSAGLADAAIPAGVGVQALVAAPSALAAPEDGSFEIARRGRGRGGDDRGGRRGGHGANDNGGGDDPSGSGRRKPRIPGGSGCDDPGDIAEHAECRG